MKIRAERRAGEMLAAIERQPGTRENSGETPYQKAKQYAGVGDTSAKNWQRIAAIPDEQFEQFIKVKFL